MITIQPAYRVVFSEAEKAFIHEAQGPRNFVYGESKGEMVR